MAELVLKLVRGVEYSEEAFGLGDLVPAGELGIAMAREECRADLVEDERGNTLPLPGDVWEVAQNLVVFESPE
jgi:hypothetical protein